MKKHRFLFSWVSTEGEVEIDKPELVAQIKRVLKLKEGETLVIFDGEGKEAEAQILTLDKNSVRVKILEEKRRLNVRSQVRLCCAVLKKENFELVVQKATEVGVREIVPIISERTVKMGLNQERLKKIALEASEQSGRAYLPLLHPPVELKEALAKFCPSGACLVFDLGGGEFPPSKGKEVTIFVGPEGGWSEEERKLFSDYGVPAVSLGDLTLRGETAAIVGSYLAVNNSSLLRES